MKKSARRQTNRFPFFLIIAGVLLIIGVLVWQATRSANPSGAPANAGDIPEPDIDRVSLADAKAALDNQQALFLDVRDPALYESGHIPGAVNIPLSELESRAGELDPNQWIVTYCT